MALFWFANGPMPTTVAQVPVTTGTSLKSLLQVKASTTKPFKVAGWGISFDGSASATPIKCELLEADVAATVTAAVAADIVKYDGEAIACGDQTTNLFPVGTSSTGYTSTNEGSVAATRMFDVQLVAPTGQYVIFFPSGERPVVQVSKFLRVRVTAGTAVNAYSWVLLEI